MINKEDSDHNHSRKAQRAGEVCADFIVGCA